MKKISVRENGLVGTLYNPVRSNKLPGIILLSGSDGGIPGANAIPESFVEHLASGGFVVFALAYFGVDGLPKNLENIPLEYFEVAIRWLKSQAEVNASNIGIIGHSRGGELSLLLGSIFPNKVNAIVASAPSSLVCGGFPYPNRPAWRYQNLPISPYLGGLSNTDNESTELDDLKLACENQVIQYHANTEEDPYIIAELFTARNSKNDAKLATIPVEKIKCPLLLFSGDQDAIWPAKVYCESIMTRLGKHQSTIYHKHINYINAGHGILAAYDGPIYHPVGEFWCKLGGTPKGNIVANGKSFIALLEFLQKTLSGEKFTASGFLPG